MPCRASTHNSDVEAGEPSESSQERSKPSKIEQAMADLDALLGIETKPEEEQEQEQEQKKVR